MALRRPRPDPGEGDIGLDPAWLEPPEAVRPASSDPRGPRAGHAAVEREFPGRGTAPWASRRPGVGSALAVTTPHVLVAAFAWLPVVTTFPRAAGLPLATLLVLLVELAGFLVAGELRLPAWRRVWLLDLAVCAVVWPVVSLHAALARAPYVSADLGSIGPVLLTALVAGVAVAGVAVIAALAAADDPFQASLLFAPAALVVPAILGTRQDLSEGTALTALGEAYAVAAITVFVAALLPRGLWTFAAAAAMAGQLGALWLLGMRPTREATTDDLAPMLSTGLLAWTIVLGVAVPLLAVAARRMLSDPDAEWEQE